MNMRFKVNPEKVIEALAWLAERKPGITPYYAAKVLYFADKEHLNRFGRPILGDTYIAMEHGPVPSLAYNLVKGDEFEAPDLLEKAAQAFLVDRNAKHARLYTREHHVVDLDLFSKTDLECLERAVKLYGTMPWPELRALTHEDPAWAEADVNAPMDFARMLEGNDDERATAIEEIGETSVAIAL